MLNCCLDYPSVRYIFHLGAPRDATDYNQAIGRCARDGKPEYAVTYFDLTRVKKVAGDDLFGCNVVYETLHDNETCRRLRLGMFFDGVTVPCAMAPGTQLCDICEAQLSQNPPETGPAQFPSHLLPNLEVVEEPAGKPKVGSTDRRGETSQVFGELSMFVPLPDRAQTLGTRLNNPLNHPVPSASFGNQFAAAEASIAQLSAKPIDEHLRQIHKAFQALATCCIYCWSQDFEYNTTTYGAVRSMHTSILGCGRYGSNSSDFLRAAASFVVALSRYSSWTNPSR